MKLRYPSRKPARKEEKHVFGRLIREPKVFVIDHENTNLGLMDTRDALKAAQDVGLELVLVSQGKNDAPSTCKIIDFGKYKFELEKKEKVAKKKQRENAVKIKEVKFRPTTNDNDLQTKAKQLKEFIDEGNRLKVTVVFRGREIQHSEIGINALRKFATMLSARYDTEPTMSGKNLNAILVKTDDR